LVGILLASLSVAGKAQLSDDWRSLAPVEPENARSRMSAFTGLTVIDGDPYWRLDLRPDFRFGKLGVGLKAVLLIGAPSSDDPTADTTTKILTEDGEPWDSASAYLRAIRFVEWATPRAPLYARFGELFDVRVGHGLLMEGYSNLDRRGVRLNLNRKAWGVESVLNNVNAPELVAGRVYVKPLAASESFLNRFTIGATAIVDTNPFPDADDPKTKGPGITDEDSLLAFAADVSYPILYSESFVLELYNEAARISFPSPLPQADATTKSGNATGVGLEVSSLRAKLEYRTFQKGFVPTLFGYDYEFIARTPGRRGEFVLTSDTTKGYYGSATLSLMEKAFVSAIFEDYNGTGPASDPRLAARFTETDLLEQVDLRMYYSKRGIGGTDSEGQEQSFLEDLVDLDEKSLFVVELAYNIKGPLQVVLTREYRFRARADGDGYEPIKKMTAQLGIATEF
jgi:hypothetical protein